MIPYFDFIPWEQVFGHIEAVAASFLDGDNSAPSTGNQELSRRATPTGECFRGVSWGLSLCVGLLGYSCLLPAGVRVLSLLVDGRYRLLGYSWGGVLHTLTSYLTGVHSITQSNLTGRALHIKHLST